MNRPRSSSADGIIVVNPALKLGKTLKVDGREAKKGKTEPKQHVCAAFRAGALVPQNLRRRSKPRLRRRVESATSLMRPSQNPATLLAESFGGPTGRHSIGAAVRPGEDVGVRMSAEGAAHRSAGPSALVKTSVVQFCDSL